MRTEDDATLAEFSTFRRCLLGIVGCACFVGIFINKGRRGTREGRCTHFCADLDCVHLRVPCCLPSGNAASQE